MDLLGDLVLMAGNVGLEALRLTALLLLLFVVGLLFSVLLDRKIFFEKFYFPKTNRYKICISQPKKKPVISCFKVD